jgi:hypothetical protein
LSDSFLPVFKDRLSSVVHFGIMVSKVDTGMPSWVLSTSHEKIPDRNLVYWHVQDFAMNDKLLLAILKEFVLQQVNK